MHPAALTLLAQDAPRRTVLGSLYQSILDGGPVMVPIALCSVVALGFFLERLMALRRGRLIPGGFRGELEAGLRSAPDRVPGWLAGLRAPVARVFESALKRRHEPRSEVERTVEDAGAREVTRLSGNLRPLVIVSNLAPLLGLLGTVTGMIKAFQVIAVEKAVGKPELLAEGIAEALITTAAGLIVAIPTQVAYYYLKARVDRFAREVETLYHEVVSAFLDGSAQPAAAS